MKLNFGHGIAIVLTIFIITFIWLGVKSFSKTFELKTENYYESDQQFSSVLKRVQNAADRGWMAFPASHSGKELCWQMPDSAFAPETKVRIELYRPADQNLDRTFEVQVTEDGRICLAEQMAAKGYYDLTFEWSFAGAEYRVEQKFFNS